MVKHSLLGFCSSLALVGGMYGSAYAEAQKPAVAAPNGKIDISGGSVGLHGSAAITGSYSIPVGHDYGIQLDAGYTDTTNSQGGGLAGHFFRRDPDSYLVGVTSMWVRFDGRDVIRHGLEAELYRDNFTYSLSGGSHSGLGVTSLYASAEAGYYFGDDLFTTLGVSGFDDYRSAYGAVEYRPWKDNSVSFFANAGVGNTNGGFGVVGIRYSFGADNVSLKKQHREYDPPNIIGNFSGGGAASGVVNKIDEIKVGPPAPEVAPVEI